jgi:hypothetical protein
MFVGASSGVFMSETANKFNIVIAVADASVTVGLAKG